jgi:hypothetical protein
MLLREHRFKFFVGAEDYVFRVEELVTGTSSWPDRCRLRLPASARTEAKTFYGASCVEVAEKAAGFIASHSGRLGKNTATHLSQGPPASPHQPPRPLQLQVSEND